MIEFRILKQTVFYFNFFIGNTQLAKYSFSHNQKTRHANPGGRQSPHRKRPFFPKLRLKIANNMQLLTFKVDVNVKTIYMFF